MLGWEHVIVIDDDLGRSGGGQLRPGFERLLAAICAGTAGAVLAIEASRLARNGRDWHTLREFCAFVNSLIIDEDGIYNLTGCSTAGPSSYLGRSRMSTAPRRSHTVASMLSNRCCAAGASLGRWRSLPIHFARRSVSLISTRCGLPTWPASPAAGSLAATTRQMGSPPRQRNDRRPRWRHPGAGLLRVAYHRPGMVLSRWATQELGHDRRVAHGVLIATLSLLDTLYAGRRSAA